MVRSLRLSRRQRRALNLTVSLAPLAILSYLVLPHAGDVAGAIGRIAPAAFAAVCLLSLATQLCRSEVWQTALRAAGGTMPRRLSHAASSFLYLGSIVSVHVGHIARIAVLRRSAGEAAPPLASMIAAETPAYVAEGVPTLLMALLVAHALHLPTALVALALLGLVAAVGVLRHLYRRSPQHRLSRGIAAIMHRNHGLRIAAATAALIAAQLARTAIVLAALGVQPSLRNTLVVYLAGGIANALPLGGAVGTAAALTAVAGTPVAVGTAVGLLLSAGCIVSSLAYSSWAVAVLALESRRRPAPAAVPANVVALAPRHAAIERRAA
jgi:hypothetical protein